MTIIYKIYLIVVILGVFIIFYLNRRNKKINKLVEEIKEYHVKLRGFIVNNFHLKPCSKCNEIAMILSDVSPNGRSIATRCKICKTKARSKAYHDSNTNFAAIQWKKISSMASQLRKKAPADKRIVPWLIIYSKRTLVGASPLKNRQTIPEKVKSAVWRRDQGRCAYCGSRENLEFDHIIPFSRGGSNTTRNLQLLCQACNRAKSNRI